MMSRSSRQLDLQNNFGFECHCAACLLSGDELRASDDRRTTLDNLYNEIAKCGSRPAVGIRKVCSAIIETCNIVPLTFLLEGKNSSGTPERRRSYQFRSHFLVRRFSVVRCDIGSHPRKGLDPESLEGRKQFMWRRLRTGDEVQKVYETSENAPGLGIQSKNDAGRSGRLKNSEEIVVGVRSAGCDLVSGSTIM
jgi:hypothetical protein